MFNEFNVATRQVIGGYHAFVRFASDASFKPVRAAGGKPEVFTTELDAYKAATRHLLRYLNGHMVRDGDIAGRSMANADAAFNLRPHRPVTRTINVKYKGRGRGGR